MTFPLGRLHSSLVGVRWSSPSTFDATGVHHGYRRVVVVSNHQLRHLPLGWVIDRFAPVAEAWLSWIDPGGYIVSHVDGGPYRERWHLPIATAGHWGDGTEMVDGVARTVEHWRPHCVHNPTDSPRIHLVIDRDVIVNPTPAPFEVLKESPCRMCEPSPDSCSPTEPSSKAAKSSTLTTG